MKYSKYHQGTEWDTKYFQWKKFTSVTQVLYKYFSKHEFCKFRSARSENRGSSGWADRHSQDHKSKNLKIQPSQESFKKQSKRSKQKQKSTLPPPMCSCIDE